MNRLFTGKIGIVFQAMKHTISIVLVIAALDATAAPCTGVGSATAETHKTEIALVVASQLHVTNSRILREFRYADWYIIQAETPASDPPFLFYHGDPMRHQYVALWSGGAMFGEKDSIERWVLKNAKGIPEKLASCFAYQVTPK